MGFPETSASIREEDEVQAQFWGSAIQRIAILETLALEFLLSFLVSAHNRKCQAFTDVHSFRVNMS